MKKPPVPANEEARLQKLEALEILDTPSERLFDDIARVAAVVAGTPIAMISLVDGRRQWFKAKIGLTVNETPRDVAFCAWAILGDEIFEVDDAAKDERFWDNPLVLQDPRIRFYAGAPLRASTGEGLGTVCVIDSKPKKLTEEQREALRALSRLAGELMESRARQA
jgi:GAF domain-containing protein